jgi:hypothetical protein
MIVQRLLILAFLVGGLLEFGSCSSTKTEPKISKGGLPEEIASLKTPAPTLPGKIWPHFLRPTPQDYSKQHLSPSFQRTINGIVRRLPTAERQYVRWLPWEHQVIVFEVKSSQLRSNGRGYYMSQVINVSNLFVDPTNGNVLAGPP